MKYTVLLVYPVLIAATALFGSRITQKNETAQEYLSLDQTKMIRAVTCLGIILHHLVQEVSGYNVVWNIPITVFNNCGFIFTALFFFFSGFGLITNVYSRDDYLQSFLMKRLPSVLIPFWFINLITILVDRFIFGIRSSLPEAFCNLFGLTLINSNGWFIIEIVVLYLIFYILFSLIRRKDLALALLCLAVVLLICFSFFRGHGGTDGKSHWFRGEWWFNSTITFVFGLMYARFRKEIDHFFKKYYLPALVIVTILAILSWVASVYAVMRYGYYQAFMTMLWKRSAAITLAVQSAACIAFTSLVLLLNMRLTIGNRVLRFLSGISTELFLIHNLFISRVFSGMKMPAFYLFGAVFLCSIASAAVISPCVKWIVKHIRRNKTIPDRDRNDTLERQNAKRALERKLRFIKIAGSIAAVLILFIFICKTVLRHREFLEEYDALCNSSVGDIVYWGRDDTDYDHFGEERLTWIVIRRTEGAICLLSEKGLSGSPYHQKHEAVTWEDSDLRALLQSEAFTDMFSKDEAAVMQKKDGDLITLLTAAEAGEFFETDLSRELAITQAAEASGTNINTLSQDNYWGMKGYHSSWWWLKGKPGQKEIYAPIVTVDGIISEKEKEVNRPNGAIRPVIWVNQTPGTTQSLFRLANA